MVKLQTQQTTQRKQGRQTILSRVSLRKDYWAKTCSMKSYEWVKWRRVWDHDDDDNDNNNNTQTPGGSESLSEHGPGRG